MCRRLLGPRLPFTPPVSPSGYVRLLSIYCFPGFTLDYGGSRGKTSLLTALSGGAGPAVSSASRALPLTYCIDAPHVRLGHEIENGASHGA